MIECTRSSSFARTQGVEPLAFSTISTTSAWPCSELAQDAGAHVIGESFHQFSPQGVTGILAIAESHISIHTWPEYGYAAADIFTCGSGFRARKIAGILVEELESRDPVITEVIRGLLRETVVS